MTTTERTRAAIYSHRYDGETYLARQLTADEVAVRELPDPGAGRTWCLLDAGYVQSLDLSQTPLALQASVRRQGVGWLPAMPAGLLQVGDLVVWNYGYVDVVVSHVRRGQSVRLVLRSDRTGETSERTMRRSTLVAVA